MSASSLIAIAAAIPSPSSSSSLPVCSNLYHLSNTHFSLTSTAAADYPFPPKPIKCPKLKTHFPNSPTFSLHSHPLLFPPSATAFDSSDITEQTEPTETDQDDAKEEIGIEEDDDEVVGSVLREAGRLYVGNLPYAMTSSQLSEVFGEAGRVVSVEIVYDRVTDRSRGFGFVTMGSVEEGKEAIRMFDGAQVGGRTVKVNFPEVPRGGEREVMAPKIHGSYQGFVDSPHKIYAGNLSWDLTTQGLKEAFADQPGVLSAKVIYDRDTGRSRGFGFVTFSSGEDAESAVSTLNGAEVEGRPLRLNLAQERAASTPPARERNLGSHLDTSELLSSLSS